MDAILFAKGLMIGFVMAIPIGPAGIMCVRKTLAEGQSRGLVAGLGAATADALYGSVAAFGLTLVSDVVTSQRFWLRVAGGGILLIIGFRTLRHSHRLRQVRCGSRVLLSSYLSGLLIALTNPLIIFVFAAVFAAFGLGLGDLAVRTAILVIGVFCGSWLWFLTLSSMASLFRGRLEQTGFQWVSRVAGMMIILSGLGAFVSVM